MSNRLDVPECSSSSDEFEDIVDDGSDISDDFDKLVHPKIRKINWYLPLWSLLSFSDPKDPENAAEAFAKGYETTASDNLKV